MRVLVCGGRNYNDYTAVRRELGKLYHDPGITCLIHGAASGADSIAAAWAKANMVKTEAYPADWMEHGKAAGPIRNAKMLAEGKPDLVVAFPGGRGTADMVSKAQAAGVRVVSITG